MRSSSSDDGQASRDPARASWAAGFRTRLLLEKRVERHAVPPAKSIERGGKSPTVSRRDPGRLPIRIATGARARLYIARFPHHCETRCSGPRRAGARENFARARPARQEKEVDRAQGPLMPKATAVWLVENTSLSFEQIADFCKLHPLEVKGIADGEVAAGIKGLDPVSNGQLTREEIEKAQGRSRLPAQDRRVEGQAAGGEAHARRGPRYTPVSRRQDRPNAILWLLRNHPELKDAQIMRLVGTTKTTIQQIRDRTHWNSASLSPMDPVTLGLCSQIDLDFEVQRAAKDRPQVEPPTAARRCCRPRSRPRPSRRRRALRRPEPRQARAGGEDRRRFGLRQAEAAQAPGQRTRASRGAPVESRAAPRRSGPSARPYGAHRLEARACTQRWTGRASALPRIARPFPFSASPISSRIAGSSMVAGTATRPRRRRSSSSCRAGSCRSASSAGGRR